MKHRYWLGAALVASGLFVLVAACTDTASSSTSSSSGGIEQAGDAQVVGADVGFIPEDPPVETQDAGKDAAVLKDSGTDAPSTGDAGSLAPCTFNRECPSTERCECENGDCACRAGTRGTGQSGVTPCATGNDCASSLCVEGQGGTFYCSGECDSAADCKSKLPVCSSIAFIGKICVRQP